jgi:hypothetical protein
MKTLKPYIAAICAVFALQSANATTVIPPSFDELVVRAQVIFQGTVTDTQSQWAGEGGNRRIVTYVTFKVDEPIKGDAGATYTLRMLGGTVDGETMEVSDSPSSRSATATLSSWRTTARSSSRWSGSCMAATACSRTRQAAASSW